MSVKQLHDDEIVSLIKEEYWRKFSLLEKDAKLKLAGTGENETLLVSPGLKVKHKNSGILYTVDAVSTVEVELLTPEGEPFIVDAGTFQKEYEL